MRSDAEAEVIDTLYRGVTDDGASAAALVLIQDMFRCRGGAFVSFDAHLPGTDLTQISGAFRDHGAAYLSDFVAIDPAPAVFARLRTGTASTTDRLFTREQIASNPFHNEFFRPIGFVETLGGTLFSDRARFALIGLQRSTDRPPFDDTDIALLERLMPHIARLLQLRRAFHGLRDRSRGLEAVIDRLSAGVILVGSEARATFVNAAMAAIAARGDGLGLDRLGGPLPANGEARRRLGALLIDVAGGGAGGIVAVPRSGGRRPYSVLVAPLPASLDGGRAATNLFAGAVVVVHDPDADDPSPPEILEAGLGLTRGATRLVAALAADGDLRSFAEAEGVTIHTARFHLRTALARTGARTQAELVRLAVRLLRDLGIR